MTTRHNPLDWLATGAAAAGVFSSLAVFDLVQRIAIRSGTDAHQRAVSRMARAINRSTALAGVRFRVVGEYHVVPNENYILVSNHQSLLDISMTSDFLERLQPRYVSKLELAQGIPGVSYNLAHGGSALIDRKNPEQSRQAIEALARHVREARWSAMIFPEGTRSRSGAMKPFKEGGLRTLVGGAPDVRILPITTSGGSKLFRFGLAPIVRGVEIVYTIHAPIASPSPANSEAFRSFVQQLAATIASALPPEDAAGTWARDASR